MWIRFMDMYSGGGCKTEYEYIYIEADSEEEGIDIFKDKFYQDPYDIGCECCGQNFSVSEYKTLQDATMYERQTYSPKRHIPLEEYVKQSGVLVIRKEKM